MSALPRVAAEMRATSRLAFPLVLTQFAGIGANVLEIALAGRLDAQAMGAVAVGTNIWHFASMGLIGVMMAVSPTIAQLDGAGRRAEAAAPFRQAIWLGLAIGLATLVALEAVGPLFIGALGIEPGLAADATVFLRWAALGAPALPLYVACRGLTEGLSMPRPSLLFGLLGLVILAPLGWLLMFPLGLGVMGTGLALTLTLWLQFFAFYAFIHRSPRYAALDWSGSWRPDLPAIAALFRLGGPMAVSVLMESGMFSATALLIGRFGAVTVAGHQVALSVAAVAFMAPLGFSIATTVRVGNAAGANDASGVRWAAYTGLGLALACQLISATIMLSFPLFIAGLYTSDAEVAAFAAGLLFLAALFQLSDGAQVAAAAALRGLKDAKLPMLITTIAYWAIGMPLGAWLTFGLDWRAPGMWWGLIAALSAAALLLWARFIRLANR